jgi:aldose 1-epimerase
MLAFAMPVMSQSNYSARKMNVDGVEIVRLSDSAHNAEVSIVPSVGNNAYDMRVNGKPVFWSPYASVADYRRKPVFLGIPFLAPWANRLDHEGYFANGKSYALNPALNNYRLDPNHHPIHGLISYAHEWEVAATGADDSEAWVTSRLEFWRYPDLMAQFPFAHTIEMTYRLRDGGLEVHTAIENLSNEPMPVAIGYHPYFRLAETHRDTWRVHIAARDHVLLSSALIPTGELKPVDLADPMALAGTQLDDVFTNLIRDSDGRAKFWFESGVQRISVLYGPKYKVAVIYAPPGKDFICFEPMTAVTNALNLAHEGKYRELESIPPRTKWEESFWIKTNGY